MGRRTVFRDLFIRIMAWLAVFCGISGAGVWYYRQYNARQDNHKHLQRMLSMTAQALTLALQREPGLLQSAQGMGQLLQQVSFLGIDPDFYTIEMHAADQQVVWPPEPATTQLQSRVFCQKTSIQDPDGAAAELRLCYAAQTGGQT
ncbi:MAG: hypothetical protein KDK39_19095, partial [Leptospiraceae bacterium]|nr:hypothetical protein [Leptospiraceae bacterium]